MRSARRRLLDVLLVLALVGALVIPTQLARSQVQEGATMTVLRGEVAVIRANGQAIQPAPSGTVVNTGDEIRTLSRAGALITFFAGTEIELGEGTILAVDTIARSGDRIDVSLRQVLGVTVNRVQTLTDPGSSYRIDAGGAVAVVRGTTFALIGPTPTSQGNIVAFVCLADCTPQTTFSGCAASPFTALGVVVERGKVSSGCAAAAVAKTSDYFDAAFESVTTFEQAFTSGNPGQANLGIATGSSRGPESNSRAEGDEEREDDQNNQPSSAATPTPTVTPTVTPTATSTLVVPPRFTFQCTDVVPSGDQCTVTGSTLAGGVVGGTAQFSIQTLAVGAVQQTETFPCGPITPSLGVTCTVTTTGEIFEGGAVSFAYPLTTGGTRTLNSTTRCNTPRPPGVAC